MKAALISGQTPICFGTDGWRAVIGDEFTFRNLKRVAQAFADYIKNNHSAEKLKPESNTTTAINKAPLIVIGYDRRFLSERFAQCAAEVLAGNNLRIALFNEAIPTPLVSWVVREAHAAGGIVITASHNPAEFNGFKIKAPWGGSASSEITKKVETFVDHNPIQLSEISKHNNSELLASETENYRRHLSEYIDLEMIRRTNATVIIDPMHGAGGRWVESFLQTGNIQAGTIRAFPDPLFGGVNPEPIDSNLSALKKCVIKSKAILGLATDGDADRLGAVNEKGQTMSMHEVVPLLLLHLIRNRGMSGVVVRTFSQSILTKRIAAAYGLPLYETPIGFKYIADLMLKEDILIGAEESGGIGVKGHLPERDGIFNSLLLLEAVLTAGKPPSEIVREIHREFGEFYFGRTDLKIDVNCGKDFVAKLAVKPPFAVAGEKVAAVETTDGTKLLFEDESWLLFRQSGTEPVLRIYSEATSTFKTNALLQAGFSKVLKDK